MDRINTELFTHLLLLLRTRPSAQFSLSCCRVWVVTELLWRWAGEGQRAVTTKKTTFHEIKSIKVLSRGWDHWELQVTPLPAQLLTKDPSQWEVQPPVESYQGEIPRRITVCCQHSKISSNITGSQHHQQLIKTPKAAQACLTLLWC